MTSLTTERIKEAKYYNTPLHIKGEYLDVPSWEDFFKSLNMSMKMDQDGYKDPRCKDQIGTVRLWENFAITFHGTEDHFEKASEFNKYISDMHPIHDQCQCMSIVSLSTAGEHIGKHYDNADVIFWQCIGKVRWHIGFDPDHLEIYDLEPGDVLYNPAGSWHYVESLTPRASLSFYFPPEFEKDSGP